MRFAGRAAVKPLHVAAYIEELQRELSAPSVNQHLAAVRMLFDRLVVGHAMEINAAHAVRAALFADEGQNAGARPRGSPRSPLIDRHQHVDWSARPGADCHYDLHLRPIGAVVKMNVRDYFSQARRAWMRLHEKRGKLCEAPCHHKLESYMDEYLAAAGFADDADGSLWRTTGRHGKQRGCVA